MVPYLGVVVSAARGGLQVVHVVPDSPAAGAGVRAGDILSAVGGKPLRATTDLDRALALHAPGDRTALLTSRGRHRATRSVRLGSRTLTSSAP